MQRLQYFSYIFASIHGDVVRKISDPKDSVKCCNDSLGRVVLHKLEIKCLRYIAEIDQDPCLPLFVLDPEGTCEISGDV